MRRGEPETGLSGRRCVISLILLRSAAERLRESRQVGHVEVGHPRPRRSCCPCPVRTRQVRMPIARAGGRSLTRGRPPPSSTRPARRPAPPGAVGRSRATACRPPSPPPRRRTPAPATNIPASSAGPAAVVHHRFRCIATSGAPPWSARNTAFRRSVRPARVGPAQDDHLCAAAGSSTRSSPARSSS